MREGRNCLSLHITSQDNVDRNEESERIPNLKYVRIILKWSEWRDSNARPLAPKASALPLGNTRRYALILSEFSANVQSFSETFRHTTAGVLFWPCFLPMRVRKHGLIITLAAPPWLPQPLPRRRHGVFSVGPAPPATQPAPGTAPHRQRRGGPRPGGSWRN